MNIYNITEDLYCFSLKIDFIYAIYLDDSSSSSYFSQFLQNFSPRTPQAFCFSLENKMYLKIIKIK